MKRREFLGGLAAATTTAVLAETSEKPLLRIGATSDDHLHPKRPKTHERAKACFALFRREQVDIVLDTGDIADLSHLDELRAFRRYFDEAFAGTATVPFFGVANHDYNYLPDTKKNDPVNIKNASLALGMSDVNPSVEVKGYQFTNYFQNEKIDVLKAQVKKAVAASEPGRPVFVMTHIPPFGTTTETEHWSSAQIREVLNAYPQVVALNGHIHTAMTSAANIWQGEFTSISLGAHAEYSNPIDGECTILDVFANRIEVRRYEAVTGREIGADDRWTIPLPLDPAHGPYRPEVRAAKYVVPQLPSAATASFEVAKGGLDGTFAFTAALPPGKARRYDIRFESKGEDGKWNFLATLNWHPPQVMEADAPSAWKCFMASCLLDAGKEHRAVISPVNCFARAGKEVEVRFTTPVATCRELPAELTRVEKIIQGDTLDRPELKPRADGWFTTKTSYTMLMLPEALSEAIAGKPSALCFDIGYRQQGVPNTFCIAKFPADGGKIELGLGGRIYTVPGECDSHRWTWRLGRGVKKGDRLCLVIREGHRADFKFNGAKAFV